MANRDNKKKRKSINVGTSLVLVTFVILCLVAFAALSYSSSEADFLKTSQTAQRNSDYYTALNAAHDSHKTYSDYFRKAAAASKNIDEYYDKINKEFSDTAISITKDGKRILLSYLTKINDSSSLQTTIATTCNNGKASFELISEKTVNMED